MDFLISNNKVSDENKSESSFACQQPFAFQEITNFDVWICDLQFEKSEIWFQEISFNN